jgi:hypothetical protein
MPENHDLPEMMYLDTLDEFDAITKPFRLAIFQALLNPASVREIAEKLEVPVTRLYYHINEMERLKFIGLVEVRKVGARTEKVYRSAARGMRPSVKFLNDYGNKGLAALVQLVFGVAETGMVKAVELGEVGLESSNEEEIRRGAIGLSAVSLSDQDRHELILDVEALIEKYDERRDPDSPAVAFFFGIYPQEGV